MAKSVNQYTIDGVFICEHESPAAAALAVGKRHRTTISSAASYNRPSAFGCIWRYTDDPLKLGTEHYHKYDKDTVRSVMNDLCKNRFNP